MLMKRSDEMFGQGHAWPLAWGRGEGELMNQGEWKTRKTSYRKRRPEHFKLMCAWTITGKKKVQADLKNMTLGWGANTDPAQKEITPKQIQKTAGVQKTRPRKGGQIPPRKTGTSK